MRARAKKQEETRKKESTPVDNSAKLPAIEALYESSK